MTGGIRPPFLAGVLMVRVGAALVTWEGRCDVFRFNFGKTLQAVAVLLRAHPLQVMGRVRLLKLLYIADRESLRDRGAPITGDHAVAMKNGPVLSETYDLIKGTHIRAPQWSEHFENIGCDVRLLTDPGTGRLSRYEIEKLNEVAQTFEHEDDWELAERTHEFPEWQKNDPGDSSRPIPFEDILKAVGRSDDIEDIREDAKAAALMDRLFGDS